MEIVGVIPARFASTRLPGKALLSETGRPLIQHVLEAARRAQSLERIIVATDDPRIAQAVERCGGEFMMTRADHATGTDRVAEVAARLESARLIVNLQGDEPEVTGHARSRRVASRKTIRGPMATLATPDQRRVDLSRPGLRQGGLLRRGRASTSREARSRITATAFPTPATGQPLGYLHLGLYAYRRDFLLDSARFPPPPRSRREARAASRARGRISRSPSASSTSRVSASIPPRTTGALLSVGGGIRGPCSKGPYLATRG